MSAFPGKAASAYGLTTGLIWLYTQYGAQSRTSATMKPEAFVLTRPRSAGTPSGPPGRANCLGVEMPRDVATDGPVVHVLRGARLLHEPIRNDISGTRPVSQRNPRARTPSEIERTWRSKDRNQGL